MSKFGCPLFYVDMKLARSIKLQNLIPSQWPEHIPELCPKCSSQMSTKVNLFTGMSKPASFLKRIAPWLSVVILVGIIILMFFASAQSVDGGQGSAMAMVAMVVVPPILLTVMANSMPKKIKLQCHQCECQTDYSLKAQ